ncbi:MAG: protein arginine kinase [Clostridia bacterium]|nr:protein arginine kinase [Clostridia bacterium]
MNKWYGEKGDNGSIVLSTRIRLARNIEEYPFPSRLDVEGKNKVNELVKSVVFENDPDNSFSYMEMKDLSRTQAVSLAERHVISPEFASCKEGTALILSSDESVSVMLCEEDHIRLQVMKSGLALEEAFAKADAIDSVLDEKLKYAFDERIGYMTSCPTNLGTAMRASVYLHLPALTACGQISAISNTVSSLGISITGAYGSRHQPLGDIYQVSNRITLGITEETAIANLKSIVLQLINQEKNAAERELKNPAMEDKLFRAVGLLSNARLVNIGEFMELISYVRMGAVNGILDIPVEKINELIYDVQPATVSVMNEDINSASARDSKRAEMCREALK